MEEQLATKEAASIKEVVKTNLRLESILVSRSDSFQEAGICIPVGGRFNNYSREMRLSMLPQGMSVDLFL